ncbi:MAG: hypothetical protein WCA78_15720 [Rhizomicrobium sp.]
MPVILGIELGDWLMGGALLGGGVLAYNAVEGAGQGVQQAATTATSTLTTAALIIGVAALAYVVLKK